MVNILYGILTKNMGTGRKFTPVSELSATQLKLRDALMTNVNTLEGVAELYIRLCHTDKDLKNLLNNADKTNTYAYVDLYPTIDKSFDLELIDRAIRKIGLPDTENSACVWDNIKMALKTLLKSLV